MSATDEWKKINKKSADGGAAPMQLFGKETRYIGNE